MSRQIVNLSFYVALMGVVWGADPQKGQILFQQRCAACHKLEQKLIGPPLGGVESRRSREWFFRFVTNSQAFIQSGDKDAVAVYEQYGRQVMPPFPDLSQGDLEDLWAYVNSVKGAGSAAAPAGEGTNQATAAAPAGERASQAVYPGQIRPMRAEDFAFLRQTFWLLVGAAVGVALLLGVVIHFVSTRAGDSRRS
ncbi:MAG: hypothetical protein D6750_07625 [Bacteroidetes bacterium]|nr:MAG: hypothetical protein D6750_07625 [Bacteroidota bacterium]